MRAMASVVAVTLMGWTAGSRAEEPASGQTEQIRAGVVVRSVPSAVEAGKSYALYLPSSYCPSRKWPVLFAFDPRGRGEVPVECFREAAEKFGYIVAGSNDSRNGPVGPSLRAGLAMINDVAQRFAIDERRLYTTGFSGGARVACTMAQTTGGKIAGVIGCGGGYPSDAGPSAEDPFVFCGTVGNWDFNWSELTGLDRQLDTLKRPHRILRFAGGHVWPPTETAQAAVEWLELQAMRSGLRPRDTELISSVLQREVATAEAQEAAANIPAAWSRYSDIAAVFQGLVELGPFQTKIAVLAEHDRVKAERKRLREEEGLERSRLKEIERLLRSLDDADLAIDKMSELRALIAVYKNEERSETEARRLMARRSLEYVSITAFYASQPLIEARRFDAALPYLQLQVEINPESTGIRYRIASVYARAGDKKRALDALAAAAEHGFADASRIEGDEAFARLRQEPRFQEVLAKVKANPTTS